MRNWLRWVIEDYGFVVVVGWLLAHTTSWILVESYRLYHSTRIKLRRIAEQTEAEE